MYFESAVDPNFQKVLEEKQNNLQPDVNDVTVNSNSFSFIWVYFVLQHNNDDRSRSNTSETNVISLKCSVLIPGRYSVMQLLVSLPILKGAKT